jgi:PAS domain S-box-containing protein
VATGTRSQGWLDRGSAITAAENPQEELAQSLRSALERTLELERALAARDAELLLARESEDKFRSVVGAMSGAVVCASAEGTIEVWGGTAKEVFGYREEEILGKPLTLLMPERYRAAHREAIKILGESGTHRRGWQPLELQGLRADGSEFDLELSLSGWESAGGVHFVGVLHDLTSRKQTEAALREMSKIVEAGPAVMFLWRAEEKWPVDYVSRNVERLLGYSPEEFQTGEVVYSDVIHPDDLQRVHAEVSRYRGELGRREFQHEPYRIVTKAGAVRWIDDRTAIRRDRSGRITHFAGVVLDITRRVGVEAQLRDFLQAEGERVKELRCLYAVGQAIRRQDELSAVFAEVVELIPPGWQYPEIARARISFDDQEYLSEAFEESEWRQAADCVVSGRKRGTVEVFYLELRPELAEGPFLAEERALVDSIAGSLSEAVERSESQAALRESESALVQAQRLESVGRLAGGVAHDFNNMLSVILGYGELLWNELQPTDPLRGRVDLIMEAGRRSAGLTKQLLAFSRGQPQQCEDLDLNALVLTLEPMLGRLLGEDVETELRLEEGVGCILADRTQIEQVLMNLAINARDSMPQGGTLSLTTTRAHSAEVPGQVRGEDGASEFALLAVSDTGCGMDEETLARAFEPFFTTKARDKGTGLGLSTVHGIVEQSGGFVRLRSQPGEGTTCEVYLPRTEAREAPRAPAGEPAPRATGEVHVLVVDDDELIRGLLESFLPGLGYVVSTASNGSEALRLTEEGGLAPDAVLTDVVMPKMSGFELVKRLRQRRPDLPVIFMSGHLDEAVAAHGEVAQGTPFLQKPFRLRDVAATLGQLLG